MSRDVSHFVVVLRENVSTERAAEIKRALLLFEDVIAAEPGPADAVHEIIAAQRVRLDLTKKLWEALG